TEALVTGHQKRFTQSRGGTRSQERSCLALQETKLPASHRRDHQKNPNIFPKNPRTSFQKKSGPQSNREEPLRAEVYPASPRMRSDLPSFASTPCQFLMLDLGPTSYRRK